MSWSPNRIRVRVTQNEDGTWMLAARAMRWWVVPTASLDSVTKSQDTALHDAMVFIDAIFPSKEKR